ncbi:putative F-box/kelch-repeat protein [Arabidopsis thaliana]
MTLTISDLPRDLKKKIFSRIPLRYVRALRLTCKEWETLIKSRSLKIDEEESQMVALMDYNLCLMSKSFNGGDPSTEIKGKLTCFDEQVKTIILRLLFGIRIWGKRFIQVRFSHIPGGWDQFSYALGYYKNNNMMKSFKLLRFFDYFYTSNDFVFYEIYDFDSGLWKTLDVTPYWRIRFFDDIGVSLKGNTYWCAKERKPEWNADPFIIVDHIICFDFTSERFGPLLPLPFRAMKESLVTLSCVREEKLAALFCRDVVVEVWITTTIESDKVSWSKFLTFGVNKVAVIFGQPLKRDKVFIIGEAGQVRDVDLGEPAHQDSWLYVCPYVPSLVQIKQPPGCKRRRQSSSENRRYKRNMMRLVELEKYHIAMEPKRGDKTI